ncbi:Transcription elongation factor SPT4 [Conoideocrella luteorostrata]|uniref:Transcription elongation factor SPT4 n=1 Tax=Conoideocrella luteorostrata TaxID=1105319 RepID=A0AAJ0FYU4_9HYPO|nr:Transcription elongation factor SPT4 [Conoideocrella luteorostrata]
MKTEVEHDLALNSFGSLHDDHMDAAESEIATPTPTSSSKQSPSQCSSGGNGPTNSKRPPRKSTLTQQQKNQKRQRATQDQLTILEVEFNKNPTPTAGVRERIAEDINMTERSVQIWFQNRRAKIKLLAKKSLETGEDIDSIPESMRAYLAMQAMETGKGLGGSYLGRTGLMPFGHNGMLLAGDQSGQGKVLIHHLTCRSLSIGKWTRVGQNTMDLIIFYSPDKCTMTYYINNEQAGYKIEYPFSYIKNIWLENNEGDPSKMGGIVIELNRAPTFHMDSSPNTNGFTQVGDFTEDLQATQCMIHHLGGNPKVLTNQLAKLVSLDSFMNRHSPQHFAGAPVYDHHAISVSAPVSPTARPSSQPNFNQPHTAIMPEHWGMSQMHSAMRPPHGHKRQRSRSVPGPIDFAMFQNQPMPSFYIQPPGEMGPPQHNPNIYAPVPQQPSGMGHNLRIDTQAGFGLDMRQYPMSATTASPSEFPPSPAGTYLSQGPETGPLPPSNFGTPYSNGAFLSPMVGAENGGTMSPMAYHSGAGEPSIVEQSPPMSMMGRPGSAELYATHDGGCAVSEDGVSLNEMYSKHTINLPMHGQSPGTFVHQQQAELDMDQLVQFDHVDPVSLSPESVHPQIQ